MPHHKELSFGSDGVDNQVRPGVYVGEATIVKATDISGKIVGDWMQRPYDCGVQLKLEIGKDFQPDLTIGGNFARAEDGSIVKWGGAFTVKQLFDNLQIKLGKIVAGKLPKDGVPQLTGKKILKLSYVTGKNKKDDTKLSYGTWNTVMLAGNGAEPALLAQWDRSVKKGYPKNYHPEIMNTQDVSFTPESSKEFTEKEETPQPAAKKVDDEVDGF